MDNGKISPVIMSRAAIMMMLMLSGCSTMIDKDTKLALKGPKVEVSRAF